MAQKPKYPWWYFTPVVTYVCKNIVIAMLTYCIYNAGHEFRYLQRFACSIWSSLFAFYCVRWAYLFYVFTESRLPSASVSFLLMFGNNFGKCGPILKISSAIDSSIQFSFFGTQCIRIDCMCNTITCACCRWKLSVYTREYIQLLVSTLTNGQGSLRRGLSCDNPRVSELRANRRRITYVTLQL